MERRRRRTAPRLAGLLVCAAVPALLLTGCSSDSGGDAKGSDDAPSTAKGTTLPTVAPARFAALPAPCGTLTKSTVTALVPKAKAPSGTQAQSSDVATRGSCSWTGNGKDGYQYRWLSVTLQRYDNSTVLGSAEDQAKKRYADEIGEASAAKGFTTSVLTGLGDQAGSASGKATVAKITSQNDTVVARTGNVVVIVEYDGAGLIDKKNPTATVVNSGALRAAKDAVASIAAANPGSAAVPGGTAGTPSSTASGSGGLSG
jgi:hypothetical protein